MVQSEISFQNDIPLSVAQSAHQGTSFVPERRGEQEREGYAQTLRQDYAELATLADTPEKLATLEIEFARYREGFRRKTVAHLIAKSRCMSSMITGPSNFPTSRNAKRNATEHRRSTEMLEFRERALKAIKKTLCPELAPIMAGDSDAVERLAAKIAEAERLQEIMRDANKIVRQSPKNSQTPEKVAALVALGLSEKNASRLFEPDCCHRYGFPDYELTNNNANVRRMRERLAQISKARATPETSKDGANARMEDCPPDNRVRLFFPGKPDVSVRNALKSAGFRWAPSLGCWQAYRNHRALTVANEMAS